MPRMKSLDKMTHGELATLRHRVERLMLERQNSDRAALREKLTEMAKAHGLTLREVLGKSRKGKGSVAVKYRDPKNPENTWTGRGRMPRWMVAATKASRAKKEDFLI
jgi:DNA-binding protein H-NS